MFLGFVITAIDIEFDEEKIQVIQDWPTLKAIIKVWSFHRLATFYRKFINNFNIIFTPFIEYLKKRKFNWEKKLKKLPIIEREVDFCTSVNIARLW